jgi:hypothetical protein
MLSLRISCKYLVCKWRQYCAQITALSPRASVVFSCLLLTVWVYTQLTSYFPASFSTSFYLFLPLFLLYFYPASTRPTNVTTSLFKLFNTLVTVEGVFI